MTKPSVLIENVSKKFGLSLRTALKYGLIDSLRRTAGMNKDPKLRKGEFWALQNVNLALEPGDALGIMGVNGSGKTTLLRILNGTYSPDAGRVTMRGRIGALIAAGAGFSPMLSGRENVFINGTLLGMSPKQLREKFDEIVDFADLGEFIDMPVRNYSSGMTVRLGFAIAVLGRPEILLVDEVLAVGDIAFQKKCYERIFALRNEGVTIILVSHSPGAVWAVCNKGLVLHHGISSGETTVEDACKSYDHNNYAQGKNTFQEENELDFSNIPLEYGGCVGGSKDIVVRETFLLDFQGEKITEIAFRQPFFIVMKVAAINPLDNVVFRVLIDGEINKAITIIDSFELGRNLFSLQPGEYIVKIKIDEQSFRPGVYSFNVAIVSKEIGVHLFFQYNAVNAIIKHDENLFLYADYRASYFIDAAYSVGKIGNYKQG